MSGIVELSTGHVFAAGSVKAVGPLVDDRPDYSFELFGVGGFKVKITIPWYGFNQAWLDHPMGGADDNALFDAAITAHKTVAIDLRQAAIDRLLS